MKKTILITGANRGIGFALTKLCLSKDLYVEAKVEAYEDLTKENSSDKYQYLLPSFELSKNFNNNLNLESSGYHKNYDTNVFEKVLINDLRYSSTPKINTKGFINKFNTIDIAAIE